MRQIKKGHNFLKSRETGPLKGQTNKIVEDEILLTHLLLLVPSEMPMDDF